MTDKPVFKITDKMFQTLVEWEEQTENMELPPPPESPNEPPKSDKDTDKDAESAP